MGISDRLGPVCSVKKLKSRLAPRFEFLTSLILNSGNQNSGEKIDFSGEKN